MLLILIKKKGVKYERLKMDAYFWLNLCNKFDKFRDVYFTSLGYWGFAMKYYKEYQEWLDEIQPIHSGLPYSILLERGDPIAFNCGYDDYLDANNLDEDEESEEDND